MISRQQRIWSFHVVVLQRMTKKCTKIYNARAQPLVCSLNLLFGEGRCRRGFLKLPSARGKRQLIRKTDLTEMNHIISRALKKKFNEVIEDQNLLDSYLILFENH